MGDVTVIITCYNEGAFIEAAVDSVLSQTRQDAISRIIIGDDGSDDATLAVLDRIQDRDPRIELRYGKGNGLARNRNLASEDVSSTWIAFLDGDDIWEAEKIEKQLVALEGRDDIGLVYSGFSVFQDGDDHLSVAGVRDLSSSRDLLRDYFCHDAPIIPSTIMVRRTVFEQIGRFDENIPVFEDSEFYCRMAAVTRFACVQEPLLRKRMHSNAITAKRRALMAHHANVAFRVAAAEPRMLRLVPRRLSRMAYKLGNSEIDAGNRDLALGYYRLACLLRPVSLIAWSLYFAALLGVPLSDIKARIVRSRRL